MKLRAKQPTAINTSSGLRFIGGPLIDHNDQVRGQGDVVTVPDDFLVQLDVFEIVEPPKGKKKPRIAASPADRAVAGAGDDDGAPPSDSAPDAKD